MAEWTQDAYEYLDGYLKQVSALAKRQGDDAEEIVSGLRDHIEQEVEIQFGDNVGTGEICEVISSIGSPKEVLGNEFVLGSTPHSERRPSAPAPQIIVKESKSTGCLVWFIIIMVVYLLRSCG